MRNGLRKRLIQGLWILQCSSISPRIFWSAHFTRMITITRSWIVLSSVLLFTDILCTKRFVIRYLLPCYLVTLLPCYLVTLLPCYLLPCYLVTLLPCYLVTLLSCLLPCYRVTLLPCLLLCYLVCYHVTLLSCYLVALLEVV